MVEQGDMVVYRNRGMFRVERVGKLDFAGADHKKDYLTLKSMENPRETVYIPAENRNVRRPIDRETAMELIRNLDKTETLWVPNERMREQEYKKCISSGDCRDWLRILKTLYGRAKSRGSMTVMDRKYQELAERALYSEFSFVLCMSGQQVKECLKEHAGCSSAWESKKILDKSCKIE